MKYKILVLFMVLILLLPAVTYAANPRLPDLRVLAVTFGRNADGERTADVMVMNAGRGSAGSYDMHTEWLDANGAVLGGCIENMSSLDVARTQIWSSITMCNRSADGSAWEDRGITIQKSNRAVKFRASVDLSPHPEGNNKIVESNESNNVFTKDIPLPDLKVISTTFGRNANGERTANVTVMNAGRGSSGSYDMHTEWLDANGAVLGGCIENMNSLNVARTQTWSSITMCNRSADGSTWEDPGITIQKSNRAVKFRASVDLSSYPEGNNKIVESNESNNVFTKDIPLPDLKVIGTTFGRNADGERTASVTVMNAGRGSAGSYDMHTEWLDANGAVLGGCIENMNSLNVARTQTWSSITMCNRSEDGSSWEDHSVTIQKSKRAVKFRASVDLSSYPEGNNQIVESSESNNVFTKDIPAPDLKIEGMNFRGTDLHPEVTIINKGAIATNSSARVAYDWYNINGDRLGGCQETIGVLARNKRFTQKNVFCGNNNSYKLATKFKATVDVGSGTSDAPESQITESNENNNSLASPIPGRVEFIRLNPPESYLLDLNETTNLPAVSVPAEVTNPIPNTTTAETPVVVVPEIVDTPVTVPTPEPVVITPEPTVTTPVTTEPVLETDTGDRHPSYTVEVSDDGLATYTVTGKFNYYGTAIGCTGPRYFTPIIVSWGEVTSHPTLDSNNNFTATHKYKVKNSKYNLSVSIINSCFQSTFKYFTVYPKF